MTDELKIDKRGHALWLTIDRPAQRNAMNSAVLQGIRAGLEQAHKDPEVRAVVLRAEGPHFTAGIDLGMMMGLQGQIQDDCEARVREKLRASFTWAALAITTLYKLPLRTGMMIAASLLGALASLAIGRVRAGQAVTPADLGEEPPAAAAVAS